MDKESKKLLTQAENILKGGRGFLLVGEVDGKGKISGGLVGYNVSQAMVALALVEGLSMSPLELAAYLVKTDLLLKDNKTTKTKKKVVKKTVAKKTSVKKTK